MNIGERMRRLRMQRNLTQEEMAEILRALDFTVEGDDITVPTFRDDVRCMNDVAEEVLRIYGYTKIDSTPLSGVTTQGGRTPHQLYAAQLRDALVGMGLNQAETFSFISPKYYDKIRMAADDPRRKSIVISNPLGEDTSVMRTTVIPSMLLMLDGKGNQVAAGGWGYLLNDAGSGFTLAREGVLAAIEYFEGLASPTPLLQDAMDFFHCAEPRKLIDRIYAPDFTPDQLAAFGRVVLQRADEGDAVCLEIAKRNMKRLAAYAAKAIERHPEAWRTGLYGGVLQHSRLAQKLFTDSLLHLQPAASVCGLSLPPEIGALVHLFKQNGMLNESVLHNLKTTYEEIRK